MSDTLLASSPITPAEALDDDAPVLDEPPQLKESVPRGRFLRRVVDAIASFFEWVFGAVALVIGLAVLSVVPILQLLSFGYLLESGARVARSGRLRDAFVGVRKAARLGSMAIGISLMLIPLQVISSWTSSAQLVDPGGPVARTWRIVLAVLTSLMVLHMIAACARGGKLRYFFWPIGTPFWLVRRIA